MAYESIHLLTRGHMIRKYLHNLNSLVRYFPLIFNSFKKKVKSSILYFPFKLDFKSAIFVILNYRDNGPA